MTRVDQDHVADQWHLLDVYRDRYELDHLLTQVDSLKRSIQRRQLRLDSARRRAAELEKMLAEARSEIEAASDEIRGSRAMGALLIEDILDHVREENGERWSPAPVRGFRVWRVRSDGVWGNQVCWSEPSLTSHCLRSVPGEDVPHSVTRCGPPACGIYAVKSLDMFPAEVASCQMRDMAVGVVALSGKVVEHELGYRAQRARAVAMVIHHDGRRITTRQPAEIAALFRSPSDWIADPGRNPDSSPEKARTFLEQTQEEEAWT